MRNGTGETAKIVIHLTILFMCPFLVKSKASVSENHFFDQYHTLLSDYASSVGGLDLHMEEPPTQLYIQVRVLKDWGSILTENGEIQLKKNTLHFLRRRDVEKLVRHGVVEHVVD